MIHAWANGVEGVLWIAIGAVVFARTEKHGGRRAGIGGTAAFAFFWFGVSDFLEIGTGAWWRPVWLLLLKTVCVATLLGCLIAYRRAQRAAEGQVDQGSAS